ncbi:MAG: sulfite exporter TauE/SafE family protein [Actinomycetota bacterium]|nr:sulfite exporter TauE/SafE family protein [Actinomycetota bacterium]
MGDWIGRLLAWLEPWLAYWLELMAGGSFLALGAAALAGVALGLSPVTYLFMPAVVGYAGGGGGASRRRAAKLSLAFVLGVTTVYVALGALWGSIGLLLLAALGSSLWLWYGLGAVALLLMGLNLAGLLRLDLPFLKTPSPGTGQRSVMGAYLLGLPFGLAGCPSCEPVRLAVLTAVAANTQPLTGALAMLAVGLGQGLILVAAGTYIGTLPNLKRFAPYRDAINRSLALVLILAAAYFAWRAFGSLVG